MISHLFHHHGKSIQCTIAVNWSLSFDFMRWIHAVIGRHLCKSMINCSPIKHQSPFEGLCQAPKKLPRLLNMSYEVLWASLLQLNLQVFELFLHCYNMNSSDFCLDRFLSGLLLIVPQKTTRITNCTVFTHYRVLYQSVWILKHDPNY